MKPVYKYILGAAGVLILLVGIYVLWQKLTSPTPPAETVGGGAPSSSLPVSPTIPEGDQPGSPPPQSADAKGGTGSPRSLNLEKVSDVKALAYWVLKDTGEVYYITDDGTVWSAKNGPDIKISDGTITAINSVVAAPDGKKVLVSFGDPNAAQWGIFDVVDKIWRPLPGDIQNAAWGANDSQLVAAIRSGSTVSLSFVDLQKNPPAYQTIVLSFKLKDVSLHFESPQNLFIVERPSSFYPSRVWLLDTKTLNLTLVLEPASGLWVSWGRNNIHSFEFSSYKNSLFVFDKNLGNQELLPFVTFPQKCGTAFDTVYCFVPENIPWDNPSSLSLPDDYLEKKTYTVDDLYTYNTTKKELGFIFSSPLSDVQSVDATNPEIVGDTIYFLNRYDGFVYSINVPHKEPPTNATSTTPTN